MTKPSSQIPRTTLVEDALELLAKPGSGKEMSDRLRSWEALSPDHEDAMRVAQAEWALFEQLDNIPPRGAERFKLAAEVIGARTIEKPAIAAGGVLALVAALALPITLMWPSAPVKLARVESKVIHGAPEIHTEVTHSTGRGQQADITLEDGSKVWLNWDSEITVRFVAAERHVDLIRGAALFDVAEDVNRPFIVHAGNAVAQVLGTQFAVQKHDADHITFKVKEGRVAVNAVDGNKALELQRAQAVTVQENALSDVRRVAASSIGSWRDGLLIFDERPLIEVLEELGYYTSSPIQLGTITSSQRPVTATFFVDDADGALKSLMEPFDLQLKQAGSGALTVESIGS